LEIAGHHENRRDSHNNGERKARGHFEGGSIGTDGTRVTGVEPDGTRVTKRVPGAWDPNSVGTNGAADPPLDPDGTRVTKRHSSKRGLGGYSVDENAADPPSNPDGTRVTRRGAD
jgi:hypothetical protein